MQERPNIETFKNFVVPDIIDYGLNGINPGHKSAAAHHHFANKNNHFYPCLIESGLTNDNKVRCEDELELPKKYKLGIINLDLSEKERRMAVPLLLEKIEKYRPKIACFIGKVAFESFEKVLLLHPEMNPTPLLDSFSYQPIIPVVHDAAVYDDSMLNWKNETSTKIFVIPSTSPIVSQYRKDDKLKLFKDLKKLVDQISNK
nr:6999_t:CDS:2 [Entrophospora candida]